MEDIIIIGGGISGICCGITLKKLGYNTLILEKNYTAGGLCATYNKNDSQLDLCIHYILGSGDEKFKKLYKEIKFFI